MNVFSLIASNPRKLLFHEEHYLMSETREIELSCTGDASVDLLKKRFPDIDIREIDEEFRLTVNNGTGHPEYPSVPEKPDSFSIAVGSNGISVSANSSVGLFYAVETITALPEEIRGMKLCDWAAVPLRMIHWDLKGYLPKFEVLCDEIRILASYRVNAILLELEDKYDYRCVKGFAVDGAYTYDEMRELSRLAASFHIRIVPKLQSIAHVDYILKHKEFKCLRENGHVFQYCAMNPGVSELWNAMAGELMEVFCEHADNGLFHIGADEPGNLGECPECKKLGAYGSYQHRIMSCINFVKCSGWKPVMWDDVVRNHSASEGEISIREILGRDAVMMYWEYGYGGRNNGLPKLDQYISEGLTVFGASGFSGCDNWAGSVPPMETRAKNIDAWTKAAVDFGLECVCATGWTRIGSADCPADPQESSWVTIVYAALSMWTGKAFEFRDFSKEFINEFYGIEADDALLSAVMNISKYPYGFQKALSDSNGPESDRLCFLRIAAAAESLSEERKRLLDFMQYYDGKLGNSLEDYRLNMLRGFISQYMKNLELWKEKTVSAYEKLYKPVTVDEIIRTRFGYLEKLGSQMQNLLDNTSEM